MNTHRDKPNVLVLMCDQLQGRVFEPGNPCRTPHIDRLISRGTMFRNAYTPNPVCSPARASFMTGLLPHNHGVLHVTHTTDSDQSCLRTEHAHWAQRLEHSGYTTGYFGKWHVERSDRLESFGWQTNGVHRGPLYTETERRIREAASPADGSEREFTLAEYTSEPAGYEPRLMYAVTNTPPEQRMMGITSECALDFLDAHATDNAPWCCMVSVTEPHDPFVCGQDAYDQYDVDALELPANVHDTLDGRPGLYRVARRTWSGMSDRQRKEAMACYYASITEIDSQFGRILTKLRESGKLDDTLVILTSDHGELLGAHGLYTKNISAAEEAYNIPMILSGPGIPAGVVSEARVGLHDLCPTLLELTGSEPIASVDSRSCAALLSNPDLAPEYQTGYAEYHGGRLLLTQRVVWKGEWKYVFNGFDEDELYNLKDDPYEIENVIGNSEFGDVLRDLCAHMWTRLKQTNDHSLYESNYVSLRVGSYGPNVTASI